MSLKSIGISLVIGAALGNRFSSTFDSAEKKTFRLGKALQKTNKSLDASKKVVAYQKKLRSLQNSQGNLGQSSDKMKRHIASVGLEFEEAKRKAKSYGLSIRNIVSEQKKLGAESQRLQTKLNRINKAQQAKNRLGNIKGAALGALGVGFAASRLIGGSFDLEDKRHQLGDVITGENREQRLGDSVKSAREFDRKSLASESDVLEINYSLRSSGLDDEAANFGATIVSKVAEVTKGGASDVGFIIGDIFTNMGEKMVGSTEEKLTRIGDVLTKTKNLFSIKDFNQLGEGLKEGLGAAIQNNITLEQTAALIGQINNGMLKGSQAGTGLNALLRQLPRASKDIGFQIIRDKNGGLDTIQTLKNLKKATDFITNPDKKALLIQKSFGDEGKKALIPLLQNLEKLEENFKQVRDHSEGTFDDGYQRRMKSASGQWRMLSQNSSMIGTTLATTLLPAINSILTPVVKFAGWVGKMTEDSPVLGKTIGILAAVVVGYGTVLTLITANQWAWNASGIVATNSLVAQKVALIGSTVATHTAVAAQWLFNAALTANPIGLVVAGVAAFSAIAFTVYKNWEPIKTFFLELWESIKSGFELVTNLGSTIGSIFGGEDEGSGSKGGRHSRRGRSTIVGGKDDGAGIKVGRRSRRGKSAVIGAALLAPTAALPANITQATASSPPASVVNNQQYHITQLPGESGEDLARRITEIQQEDALREESDV